MVDVHVGLGQEVADDLDVTAFGGRDEGDAAVAIRDRRVGAGLVDEAQDVEQALGAGVQERVVEDVVLQVDVGAGRRGALARPRSGGPRVATSRARAARRRSRLVRRRPRRRRAARRSPATSPVVQPARWSGQVHHAMLAAALGCARMDPA